MSSRGVGDRGDSSCDATLRAAVEEARSTQEYLVGLLAEVERAGLGGLLRLLLPRHTLTDALEIVETLRSALPADVGMTVGIAVWDREDAAAFGARLETALVRAKQVGHGRPVILC